MLSNKFGGSGKRLIVEGFFEGDTSCPYRNEYSSGDRTPLLRASRAVRIEALKHLPELLTRGPKID